MRYPATEKLEIIRLVERSHLPVRRTLRHLGVPKTSFYRWYDRYQSFGERGLEDSIAVLTGSGTASPMLCETRSLSWHWMSQSCRHGSWP